MSDVPYPLLHRHPRRLAWVNEAAAPNKCGCRNLRCCEETGHKPGACNGAVATKFWTFRWEYYCAPGREDGRCGAKVLRIHYCAIIVTL